MSERCEGEVKRVTSSAAVAAGTSVLVVLVLRQTLAPVNRITMGPGGWVSIRGAHVARRPPFGGHAKGRPLWARALRAAPVGRGR